ncbi:Thioredoxin domain-containing protein 17 [Diaporthe eres]|uniref:Thioredoxin domain-containing protein 17 n=1 Tax=Diaporthe eres TaxID=83184 RepID=A0ABR1NX95_DIAER
MGSANRLNSERLDVATFGSEQLLTLPSGHTIDLASGYIPLLTRFTFEDKAAKGLRKRKAGQKPEPPIHFSALELVRDNQILLLTGPSGSGKTTFAKYLCFQLINEGFNAGRALVRNDLGDVHQERWNAGKILPHYYVVSSAESLKSLVETTLPSALEAVTTKESSEQDDPLASEPVVRNLLSRLSLSRQSEPLVDELLNEPPSEAQRAALIVAEFAGPSERLTDKIRSLVLDIVTEGTLTASEREKAGHILSRLGDPRELKPLAFVPAGNFTMGSTSDSNSQPLDTIALPSFRIGLYPVVNKDYHEFTQDTGREWLSPDGADPERQNAPATDLTWHDARAYCAWLTDKWRSKGTIGPEEQVRLPTEPEWERAARGDQNETGTDGLIYPWGTKWQDDAANSEETGLNSTCAVGLFLKGRSPYGCYDMAGHVWEWCTTLWGDDMATPSFSYPWREDGREDLDAPEQVRRVLRGGCFSKATIGTTMTIISSFTLPATASALALPVNSQTPFFITFTTSDLPETGQSWCPDVRAALPHLKAAFSAEGSPEMAFVEVGQRPE